MSQFARFHGRKGAAILFGLSLVFSFLTAFHFDLEGENIVDIFLPTIHARDLLSRKLQAATEKDPFAFASAEWEEEIETQVDYRECALYQPKRRPKHGCTTGVDSKIPYCQVQNLKIDWTKISGPVGGEPLDKVMGRDEDLELPKYLVGAFTTKEQLELDRDMNRDYWFYLLDVFMAMDITRKASKCKTILTGTSLLITRYEYVDLYHTLKDLWNAFMVLPYGVTKVDRVIFLDAHAHGWLDQAWKDMFGETMHVKELDEDTCLETAIFVPSGYSSVLWPLGRVYDGHRCPAMAKAFVDFVVKGYGLESIKMQEKSVLIFEYVHHIVHPRSAPETHHDNSLAMEMQAKIMDETEAISVQVQDLHKLSFKSQLKLVRQAQILMGNQGEDGRNSHLAHAMFLQDGATFVEIKRSGNDMENIARWIPAIAYRSLYSSSETTLIDYEILPNIKDILTPGWDDAEGVKRFPESYYESDPQYNEADYDEDFANKTDDEYRSFSEGEEIDADMEDEDLLNGWRESIAVENTANYHQCSLNQPYPRPLHGCRINEDSKTPYCQVQNFRIDTSKIHSQRGGEYVDTVMGRDEDLEFPKYLPGALTVERELDIPATIDKSMFYYLNDVMDAITISPGQPCAQTITDPVLFITRYEYVSIFHTLGDWWNAFFALPEGLNNARVVFLDAHAEGFLDSAWKTLFGEYDYVKQLSEGGVCYKTAIFIAPGYSSVLWPRDRVFTSSPCPSMAKTFSDHVMKAFNLEDVVVDEGRITIIDRVPFVSHPRRDPSQEERTIQNLDFLKASLEKDSTATNVEILDLERTPFVEQLRIIRQSHIVIGHHEAGLAELMFLNKGTHVFELDASQLMAEIARWKPDVTHRTFEAAGGMELSEYFVNNQLLPSVKFALERKDEEDASERIAAFN